MVEHSSLTKLSWHFKCRVLTGRPFDFEGKLEDLVDERNFFGQANKQKNFFRKSKMKEFFPKYNIFLGISMQESKFSQLDAARCFFSLGCRICFT